MHCLGLALPHIHQRYKNHQSVAHDPISYRNVGHGQWPTALFIESVFDLAMANNEDLDHSRQGLLKEHSIPLRPSRDKTSRSSSELGDDLDELQFDQDRQNKFRNGRRWPWVAQFRRIISGGGPSYDGERRSVHRPTRSSKLRSCLWRRRTCLTVTVILVAGIIIALSGSALWVYKTAPEDGVCPLTISKVLSAC